MATEHSSPVPPGNLLTDLLLDIDLAILGAPAPRFNEYEAQIRKEYGWVDEAAYQEGRGKVMAHFRALAAAEPSPLYRTAAGRTLLAQARANLGVSE
jgi:predicted metal-dependent HD superfamily phosphohydrolase